MFKLSILFTVFGAVNSLCTEESVYVTGAEALNADGCYTSTSPIFDGSEFTDFPNFYTRDGLGKDGPFLFLWFNAEWFIQQVEYDSGVYERTGSIIYMNDGTANTVDSPADTDSTWRYGGNILNIDITCGCSSETSSSSSSSGKSSTLIIAIISSIALMSLVILCVLGVIYRKRKKNAMSVEEDGANYPVRVEDGANYPVRVEDGKNYPVRVEDGKNYPVRVEDGKNYPMGVMCVQGYLVEPSCPHVGISPV